ncbi:hypothetical protein [Salinibaculum rarum]|uniref:hypothetical protein n=1 Tax=Salinibaculum rarum TaxID=3058903 RepID=UPI00265D7689|nr:hypothetical protein [Salinibaculum sp. KK48]
MGMKSLLRVGYLMMVVQGLLSVFLPKKALKLATAGWRVGFENVDELEPREWYVEVTKIAGVGMLAGGLTGLLVTSAENAEKERSKAQMAAGESASEHDSDADTDESDDDDGGPVTIDIDDDE